MAIGQVLVTVLLHRAGGAATTAFWRFVSAAASEQVRAALDVKIRG